MPPRRRDEPPFVHVDSADSSAKFWLQPVSVARNRGFTARELRQLQGLVEEHQVELMEAWDDYFGSGSG